MASQSPFGELSIESFRSDELLSSDLNSPYDLQAEANTHNEILSPTTATPSQVSSQIIKPAPKSFDRSNEGASGNLASQSSESQAASPESEQQKTEGFHDEQAAFEATCKGFSFRYPVRGVNAPEASPGESQLEPLREKLSLLFLEIVQIGIDDKEARVKDPQNYDPDGVTGVFSRCSSIYQAFVDTRNEIVTKEQEVLGDLISSLVKKGGISEEMTARQSGCNSNGDLQLEASFDLRSPSQKTLILTIDKTGNAYLKTNDPATFLRLSRMIDLKRHADVKFSPFAKRRCTEYPDADLMTVLSYIKILCPPRYPPEKATKGYVLPHVYNALKRMKEAEKASAFRASIASSGSLVNSVDDEKRMSKFLHNFESQRHQDETASRAISSRRVQRYRTFASRSADAMKKCGPSSLSVRPRKSRRVGIRDRASLRKAEFSFSLDNQTAPDEITLPEESKTSVRDRDNFVAGDAERISGNGRFAEAFLTLLKATTTSLETTASIKFAVSPPNGVQISEGAKDTLIVTPSSLVNATSDQNVIESPDDDSGIGYDQMPLIIAFVTIGVVLFVSYFVALALFLY
ncbi:hypothetical protein L207DRAFT_529321 [Hyaloscypha variabilis F]|uniref:Uncharacterized protein n=1 Tax=Hyaloscypha variabilis (strain UAMH 11265 / GT02V1 / F) TaxID=1149755 RepID=A0A2J6RRC2_HYAVF|nr:hypothetical protein L207DRAFT_529321 [Hyaloscypha variabilis F]